RTSLHRREDAARLRLSGTALRERLRRPEPPADAPPDAPEGGRRLLVALAAGADRRDGAQALRDDPRRQRLAVVHQRRAGPALVERPVARARPAARLGLRGRRHLVIAAAVTHTWDVRRFRPP